LLPLSNICEDRESSPGPGSARKGESCTFSLPEISEVMGNRDQRKGKGFSKGLDIIGGYGVMDALDLELSHHFSVDYPLHPAIGPLTDQDLPRLGQ